MIFWFYIQGSYYNFSSFSVYIPKTIKVGCSFVIKGYFYQNLQNDFFGSIINILNELFIKLCNIKIDYFYFNDNEESELLAFDCILVMDNKKQYPSFLYSIPFFEKVKVLEIKHKNEIKNKKFIGIKSDILYYTHLEDDEFIFFDSLNDACIFLALNKKYTLLLSEIYYQEMFSFFKEKDYNLNDYDFKRINKKIKIIYFIFKEKFYWFLFIFNNLLRQIKEKEGINNGIRSINYF
jgi:hypothetical protein